MAQVQKQAIFREYRRCPHRLISQTLTIASMANGAENAALLIPDSGRIVAMETQMAHGQCVEAALRRVQIMIALLNRGTITPGEAAENILDSLAHAEAYEIVHQVAEMLPASVNEPLKLSVEDILNPGSQLRTFQGLCFSTKEEEAEYNRQIHSQFIRVAMSLREYWNRQSDQP